MKAHRFDLLSMLLGVAFVIAGIAAISSRLGKLLNDRPEALIPLVLLGIGVAAIVAGTRRSLQDRDRSGGRDYDPAE